MSVAIKSTMKIKWVLEPKSLSGLIKDYRLTEKNLKQPMRDEHCHEIAKQTGKDWESLTTELKIHNADVDDIME